MFILLIMFIRVGLRTPVDDGWKVGITIESGTASYGIFRTTLTLTLTRLDSHDA